MPSPKTTISACPEQEMANHGQVPSRLVAVVVTHNRSTQLEKTLETLLAAAPEELHAIIVVDNMSSDGTDAVLNRYQTSVPDRLTILRSKVNLGGAGGFALGLQNAVALFDPDWVVVMDDDARPMPGALNNFHCLDRSHWDAIAAAVYFPSGELCEMNRPSRNPFANLGRFARLVRYVAAGRGRDGFHIPRAAYLDDRPVSIDAASFVGLFLSRRAIQLVGYPDARLFLYGDDVLYTLSLVAAGGRICFDPRVRFEHEFTTIAATQNRFTPLWKSYYHHRNLLIVYRQAAGVVFWPALLLILPKWFLKVRHHAGERTAFLRLLRRAVTDGLIGRLDVTLTEIKAVAISDR